MKGVWGLWRDNFGPYGLRRQSRWNMNGMWDFGETILDSMDLEYNIDGQWRNNLQYEKLCLWQLDYPTTKAPKQLIYNCIANIPWKYDK
jgi:hypothetical protein